MSKPDLEPDAVSDFIVLHGRDCTAVLERADPGPPLWRYWGPRLPDGALPEAALESTRPLPSFSLDAEQPLSLFPLFGVGGFTAPALAAHRAGHDFAQAFTACEIVWTVPGQALVCRLTDAVAGLEVEVRMEMHADASTLTLGATLIHTGEGVLDVGWLAAAVIPLPPQSTEVRTVTGRHNAEFVPTCDLLGRNGWSRENRRGLTSHDRFPGAVVTTAGAGPHTGTTYGAQLAWSGNAVQRIEWIDDGRWQWQLGEGLAPGEIRLARGERLVSPEVLATCSAHGLDGVAQNFHAAVRARSDWPGGTMAPRKVHLNTWEGFYFRHRLDELKALADAAAEVGVERFVLDDGWFHGRDDDTSSLGDWWPDAAKYPDGLAPLVHHVTGLGMDFGLWVEPEMINPDSDLYRAHPDWALHLDGRPRITARNQLVLDLGREEVRAYLLDRIGPLLDALPIAYLKWDHNRDLTTAGHQGRAAYHTQVRGAWALMDAFRARWPGVEIEACAGGGGRIDAGIATRTHRFWTSDCIDAVSRMGMQPGYLQFMPPERMGSHVGTAPAHSTGRSQSLDFRAAVAMTGHLGVEFDLRRLPQDDRTRLAAWIAFYKRHRDHLHGGRVWRGEAGDGLVWQAHGAADGALLLFVYRLTPATQKYAPPVRLPMLAEAGPLRVRRLRPEGLSPERTGGAPWFDRLEGDGVAVSGAWLAASGLPVPAMTAESCVIYSLSKDLT